MIEPASRSAEAPRKGQRRAGRRPDPRLVLRLSLGVLTAIGGFLDVGAIATAGAAGAKFRLGLVWAFVLGTLAIILLLLMVGRFTAATGKPYAAAVREQRRFRGEGPLEAWVWRMVVNAALKQLRAEPSADLQPPVNGAAPTSDPEVNP